jgi:hypothetical protein
MAPTRCFRDAPVWEVQRGPAHAPWDENPGTAEAELQNRAPNYAYRIGLLARRATLQIAEPQRPCPAIRSLTPPAGYHAASYSLAAATARDPPSGAAIGGEPSSVVDAHIWPIGRACRR